MDITISGAVAQQQLKHCATVQVSTVYPSAVNIPVEVAIAPKLPAATPPEHPEEVAKSQLLNGLELENPHMGGKIDMVVGTGDLPLFWKDGQPKKFSAVERIIAINTVFGWTIYGPMSTKLGVSMKLELVENDNKLFHQMYQLEQVPHASTLTPEEQSATQQVEQSIKQYDDGRYSCRLPRVRYPPKLGDSKQMAKASIFRTKERCSRWATWRHLTKSWKHT